MGHSIRFLSNTPVISMRYKKYRKKQSLPIMKTFTPSAEDNMASWPPYAHLYPGMQVIGQLKIERAKPCILSIWNNYITQTCVVPFML